MTAAIAFNDPLDLVLDAPLDDDKRDALAEYLEQRTGHDGVRCWPVDELAVAQ